MKLLRSDIKTKEVLDWKGVHLINYKFSACSMKSRIYMNLKGINYTSHWVNLSAGLNTGSQSVPNTYSPRILSYKREVGVNSKIYLNHIK